MLRDKYKIILIKENHFQLKQYSISFIKFFTIFASFIFFIGINIYFFSKDILNYFEFKEIQSHRKNNIELLNTIEIHNQKLEDISKLVDSLRFQEEKFRKLVRLPSIHKHIRQLGTSKDEAKQQSLNNLEYLIPNNVKKISELAFDINHLYRSINLEILSYDDILNQTEKNLSKITHYPAIHPVDFKSCKKTKWIKGKRITGDCYQSSKFGNRRHPLTLKWHHHDGDDYSANTGTSVFATADGRVEKSQYSSNSGNYVLINHGYGYRTYYGHLSKRYVKKGDKIERGDKVGEVGNTGRSTTAEHLHYEVQFNNQAKNPKDYFFDYSNSWAN